MTNIVVFYDDSFPFQGERPTRSQLDSLSNFAKVCDAQELPIALAQADTYLHLHGGYFPKASWPAILRHTKQGKGLVTVGGAPFRFPVVSREKEWHAEPEQTAYHQELHIQEVHPVKGDRIQHWESHQEIPLFKGFESLFSVQSTVGFTLHVTRQKDMPHENGSSGPMDAHIYPLLKGFSKKERCIASPAVLLEHTKGDFAGGRWICVNLPVESELWSENGLNALQQWAAFTARGADEMWVKPQYAMYYPGEMPRLTIQQQQLKAFDTANQSWTYHLALSMNNETLWEESITISSTAHIQYHHQSIPVTVQPGLYELHCKAISNHGEERTFRQGFWGMDEELLQEGTVLSCDEDYFQKDGEPFPIVGMTYMTSDVARKFLFLPNVHAWDADMKAMKDAHINYIRTGLWTGFRQVMFTDGHPSEEVLRAVDAFILTAKRHGLEVTFNFFSFTPELWEGENPYLDPRSVEAQKRMIAGLVSRHTKTTNIEWDLINEPSLMDPKKIFTGAQPLGDRFEQKAFIEWIKARHGTIESLQEAWNKTPEELPSFEAVRPISPDSVNFRPTEKLQKNGRPWLDFTLFTMDMHNVWAKELTDSIKAHAPNQLVTVGQDEGLAGGRPSPFFYAEAVDYTTVHSWWLMDQLVWDGLFTKVDSKPSLIQETGIMYTERPDGFAKRSDEELKAILERKYAYAFSTGGAGAVQWLWNVNHYMDNINESNIGAVRSDGSEKPEVDVSMDFGSFMNENRKLFKARTREDIAVVYPFSNDFSARKVSYDATAKLTRIFTYDLRIPFRGVGEYHLEELEAHPPKVIFVPSAHNFDRKQLEKLLSHVRKHGSTLVWTGPLHLDEYWRSVPKTLVNEPLTRANIRREELLQIGEKRFPVSFFNDRKSAGVTFSGNRLAEIETERVDNCDVSSIHSWKEGKGSVVWCPLPLELNERDPVLLAFYEQVLQPHQLSAELDWETGGDLPGIYGRKLTFENGSLFIFVSEAAYEIDVAVRDKETGKRYSFSVESERTVMFSCQSDGTLTSIYRPEEVQVECASN
ncbi:beta-galactosidase [Aureibacillus halotolerans]|uniref:Beta-galactosidase-like protein n=1 Tax=Aureibacillus halotolerans TaxID=1508390 RepID=A0A4R6UAP8_9BACI|nr:beta-galactosidase [Aureibacillus halotolerans]TDQ42936.1 beta-galactosidase-like protein [Aureibacillus halotolerans]